MDRSGDSRWTSQFGLYRYQSADSQNKNQKIRTSLYSLLGMACISIFLVLVFIINDNDNKNTPIIVPNIEDTDNQKNYITTVSYSEQIDYIKNDDFYTTPLNKKLNDTNYLLQRESRSGTEMELTSSNDEPIQQHLTDIYSRKILLLPPSDYLKPPPSFHHKTITTNRRHFDNNAMYFAEPHPFHFQLNGPTPSAFQKPNRSLVNWPYMPISMIPKVNNIQDIINQADLNPAFKPLEASNSNIRGSKIQFAGTYRTPKNYNGLTRMLDPSMRKSSQGIKLPTPSSTQASSKTETDLFHNYKPQSPSDVNLLAVNQFRFAPYAQRSVASTNTPPNQQKPYRSESNPQTNDLENMYHQIIKTNDNRGKLHENKRIGAPNPTQKPFSLMLDIYPMPEEETKPTSEKPVRTRLRRPNIPIPGYYQPNGINGLQYSNPVDNSYFHTMNFPQIQQPRYPVTNIHSPIYHRPQFIARDVYSNDDQSHSVDHGEKPSQMVVHLNLFPKKKLNRNRSSQILSKHIDEAHDRSSHENDPELRPRNMESEMMHLEHKNNDTVKDFLTSETDESTFSDAPKNYNGTKAKTEVEILKSVEIHPNINFDNFHLNLNSSSLPHYRNPIDENLHNIPVNINNEDIKFRHLGNLKSDKSLEIDERSGTIPINHRISDKLNYEDVISVKFNSTQSSIGQHNNINLTKNFDFNIPTDTIIKFERKDAIKKQSNRDIISDLNINEDILN